MNFSEFFQKKFFSQKNDFFNLFQNRIILMSDGEYGLSYLFRPSKSCGLILKPDTQRVRIITSIFYVCSKTSIVKHKEIIYSSIYHLTGSPASFPAVVFSYQTALC